jgi:hypothetical protein
MLPEPRFKSHRNEIALVREKEKKKEKDERVNLLSDKKKGDKY